MPELEPTSALEPESSPDPPSEPEGDLELPLSPQLAAATSERRSAAEGRPLRFIDASLRIPVTPSRPAGGARDPHQGALGASAAVVPPIPSRSIEPLAIDNAGEGCVRETFGAALAAVQAQRATDPTVRAMMVMVARTSSDTRRCRGGSRAGAQPAHCSCRVARDAWSRRAASLAGRLARSPGDRISDSRVRRGEKGTFNPAISASQRAARLMHQTGHRAAKLAPRFCSRSDLRRLQRARRPGTRAVGPAVPAGGHRSGDPARIPSLATAWALLAAQFGRRIRHLRRVRLRQAHRVLLQQVGYL